MARLQLVQDQAADALLESNPFALLVVKVELVVYGAPELLALGLIASDALSPGHQDGTG
jgi:hypothetical protein